MSAVLTPPPAPNQRRFRFTREQYYELGRLGFFDGKRVIRIRGEIIEMSPKNWPHVVGCRKTADVLQQVFAGVGWVAKQDPISLADSDPEPDVAVISGRPKDYTDHPTTALLIVEVADTSLFDDTTTMAEVYAEAGIPDYWVLDLNGRQLIVFRNPKPIPDGGAAYHDKTTLGPADTISPLSAPGASITVGDLLP